ncbi:MAG: hypothetical protein WBE20_06680 [Candidatus Acidiferrales bacterium]
MATTKTNTFPQWIRWASVAWLAVWIPAYWITWGASNFIHLCDIAVILTCAGIWLGNARLLSSQAVSSIAIDLLWDLDAAWKIFFGHTLLGATDYLWDANFPHWVRMLSLFHVVWPILLLWSLKRAGYDRSGFIFQTSIAALAMVAARYTNPAQNINYVFSDPILHRMWGPEPAHLALMWIGLVVVIYLPTHIVLRKISPPPEIAS